MAYQSHTSLASPGFAADATPTFDWADSFKQGLELRQALEGAELQTANVQMALRTLPAREAALQAQAEARTAAGRLQAAAAVNVLARVQENKEIDDALAETVAQVRLTRAQIDRKTAERNHELTFSSVAEELAFLNQEQAMLKAETAVAEAKAAGMESRQVLDATRMGAGLPNDPNRALFQQLSKAAPSGDPDIILQLGQVVDAMKSTYPAVYWEKDMTGSLLALSAEVEKVMGATVPLKLKNGTEMEVTVQEMVDNARLRSQFPEHPTLGDQEATARWTEGVNALRRTYPGISDDAAMQLMNDREKILKTQSRIQASFAEMAGNEEVLQKMIGAHEALASELSTPVKSSVLKLNLGSVDYGDGFFSGLADWTTNFHGRKMSADLKTINNAVEGLVSQLPNLTPQDLRNIKKLSYNLQAASEAVYPEIGISLKDFPGASPEFITRLQQNVSHQKKMTSRIDQIRLRREQIGFLEREIVKQLGTGFFQRYGDVISSEALVTQSTRRVSEAAYDQAMQAADLVLRFGGGLNGSTAPTPQVPADPGALLE